MSRNRRGAGEAERLDVAPGVVRVAVGVDNMGHRERLRLRSFDQRHGLWRGVNEDSHPCVTIAQEIAEVAVAAGPDLFKISVMIVYLRRRIAPR